MTGGAFLSRRDCLGLPVVDSRPPGRATVLHPTAGTFPVGQRAARSLPERWSSVPAVGGHLSVQGHRRALTVSADPRCAPRPLVCERRRSVETERGGGGERRKPATGRAAIIALLKRLEGPIARACLAGEPVGTAVQRAPSLCSRTAGKCTLNHDAHHVRNSG